MGSFTNPTKLMCIHYVHLFRLVSSAVQDLAYYFVSTDWGRHLICGVDAVGILFISS